MPKLDQPETLFKMIEKKPIIPSSKELLENLNKITASKTNPVPIPNTRVFLPETNKFWKSQLTDGIHEWPKEYHKGPWNKVVDEDGTVDYWAPFDRIYGGLATNSQRLVQKDGTEYQGKLHSKRRLIKHETGFERKHVCMENIRNNHIASNHENDRFDGR